MFLFLNFFASTFASQLLISNLNFLKLRNGFNDDGDFVWRHDPCFSTILQCCRIALLLFHGQTSRLSVGKRDGVTALRGNMFTEKEDRICCSILLSIKSFSALLSAWSESTFII